MIVRRDIIIAFFRKGRGAQSCERGTILFQSVQGFYHKQICCARWSVKLPEDVFQIPAIPRGNWTDCK
jgi:hypothetical protein